MEATMQRIVAIAWLAMIFSVVKPHSYHLSKCPDINQVPGLDMKQFLGVWFGIEKTSTVVECLTYNIEEDEKNNGFILQQEKYSAYSKTHTTATDAKLKFVNQTAPMRIKFPSNFFWSSSFVILTTDYDHYAAVFTCQSFKLFHRLSAVVMSRNRTLEQIYKDRVYEVLTSYNISTTDLVHIRQRGCARSRYQKT